MGRYLRSPLYHMSEILSGLATISFTKQRVPCCGHAEAALAPSLLLLSSCSRMVNAHVCDVALAYCITVAL